MKLDSNRKGLPPREALSSSSSTDSADRIYEVIQDVHTNVASPLASLGLQLELLRLNPNITPEVAQQLGEMIRSLDAMITVLRTRSRDLRDVERQLRGRKD
jgi:hypothetical protein